LAPPTIQTLEECCDLPQVAHSACRYLLTEVY
jgi:hypothetical protein